MKVLMKYRPGECRRRQRRDVRRAIDNDELTVAKAPGGIMIYGGEAEMVFAIMKTSEDLTWPSS